MNWRLLPFAAALLGSLPVLFTPESGVPTAPPGTDKVVHCLLFALLTGTGLFAQLSVRPLLAGLAGYALVSEVLQEVLPIGRSFDLLDVLTDLAGLIVGGACFRAVNRYRVRRLSN